MLPELRATFAMAPMVNDPSRYKASSYHLDPDTVSTTTRCARRREQTCSGCPRKVPFAYPSAPGSTVVGREVDSLSFHLPDGLPAGYPAFSGPPSKLELLG